MAAARDRDRRLREATWHARSAPDKHPWLQTTQTTTEPGSQRSGLFPPHLVLHAAPRHSWPARTLGRAATANASGHFRRRHLHDGRSACSVLAHGTLAVSIAMAATRTFQLPARQPPALRGNLARRRSISRRPGIHPARQAASCNTHSLRKGRTSGGLPLADESRLVRHAHDEPVNKRTTELGRSASGSPTPTVT
jgi:hypothetical protein